MRPKQAIMTLEKPASAYMFIHYIYFSSLLKSYYGAKNF